MIRAPLAHLQMLLGIDEQALFERRLADFEVIDPGQDLVRRAVRLDDLEGLVHWGDIKGTSSQGLAPPDRPKREFVQPPARWFARLIVCGRGSIAKRPGVAGFR